MWETSLAFLQMCEGSKSKWVTGGKVEINEMNFADVGPVCWHFREEGHIKQNCPRGRKILPVGLRRLVRSM